MADNWYLALDLAFDPPEEDEGRIAARIDEKARFWSTHFNDFKNGPQYRSWHQSISQIRRDMIGENNRRAELAAEAAAQVYGPLDKLLKTIGRKGNITGDEAEKIAQKLKLDKDAVRKRAEALKIKCVDTDYQPVYQKYYKTRPKDAAVYDGFADMLSAFGVDNLYDFLYQGQKVENAADLPAEDLRKRAQEKKAAEFYKTDSRSGTGAKLCQQCSLAFQDEDSKAVYDQYLSYKRRKAVLEEMKSVAEISALSGEQVENYTSQLTQTFRDRKLAVKVLTAFCSVEKIPITQDTGRKNRNTKICRCGCENDVSDGRTVCWKCGRDLVVRCPRCGTENDASTNVCKCGFRFENLDRAAALSEQAERAMERLDFSAAQAHLSDAERYWPGAPRAASARQRLAEMRSRTDAELNALEKARKARRYMEARTRYRELRNKYPRYENRTAEEEIRQAIERAEALRDQAKSAVTDQERLELCTQAAELCADLPGVREQIPPPPPVTGVAVSVNPAARSNVITWNTGQDKSVRYVVVRNGAGWVRSPRDGETLYQGSGASYEDKAVKPGVPYYYNVFAERGGVFSQAGRGKIEECVNLFEVSGVSAAPGDGTLRLRWDPLPEGASAVVCAFDPDGKRRILSTVTADGCLVSGLPNNRPAAFHVSLVYRVGGQVRQTPGVRVTGTPLRPLRAVDSLRISQTMPGLFEAVWLKPEGGEARLYGSTKKPSHRLGEVLSLQTLEGEMQPLSLQPLSYQTRQSLGPGEEGAAFSYPGETFLYVTAAVVQAGSAVFGSVARAGQSGGAQVRSVQAVNGKIHIYVDPPAGATGFLVLYRFDRPPAGIGDTDAARKYIPLKQYQYDSALALDTLETRKYFFSVFAEYREGAERDYSAGTDCVFNNAPKTTVEYSIAVSRRFLGESTIRFTFTSGQTPFSLPALDIMSSQGSPPVFKASARLLFQIPAQQADSPLTVSFPLPSLPRNTFVKAFFQDSADAAAYQILLSARSSNKIT